MIVILHCDCTTKKRALTNCPRVRPPVSVPHLEDGCRMLFSPRKQMDQGQHPQARIVVQRPIEATAAEIERLRLEAGLTIEELLQSLREQRGMYLPTTQS